MEKLKSEVKTRKKGECSMLESIPVEILGEIIAFTSTMEKMKLLKISKEVRTYLLSTTLFVVGTTNSNSSRMNYRSDFAHFFLLYSHLYPPVKKRSKRSKVKVQWKECFSPKEASDDNWKQCWFSSTKLSSTDRHELFFGSSLLRQLQLYRISSFAGTDNNGYSGDGGLAIHASFDTPVDVCVRPDGSLIIADSNSCRLRVVDPHGIIHTIVGTGERGHAGDGGPALHAKLRHPASVCLDPQGRIVFADASNHCIRRIELDGTIHTIAGIPGNKGMGGDEGIAKEFLLKTPYGVHVCDDGKILIADTDNHRVCILDESGKICTLVGAKAKQTEVALEGGWTYIGDEFRQSRFLSVSQDKDGRIFTADDCKVLRLEVDGTLNKFTSLSYYQTPTYVSLGNDGTVYVVANDWVYVMDEEGKFWPFAKSGKVEMSSPSGRVSGERGKLFVADSGNHCVWMMEGWFTVASS